MVAFSRLKYGRIAMIGGIGHWELLLIAFVAFLLFGNRLPGLMKSAGASLRGFREGMEGTAAERDATEKL